MATDLRSRQTQDPAINGLDCGGELRRIVAASVPRVAPTNAAEAPERPSNGPMLPDSGNEVLTTGRLKAATRP